LDQGSIPMKARGPSEQQRVLWALTGFMVPVEGAVGRWEGMRVQRDEWMHVTVRVTRVSATGKTIWVRFPKQMPLGFGALPDGPEAEYAYWYDTVEHDGTYRSNGHAGGGPYGQVSFGPRPF
jgi:hypothetical protein